jgi:hypothetical protein
MQCAATSSTRLALAISLAAALVNSTAGALSVERGTRGGSQAGAVRCWPPDSGSLSRERGAASDR